MEIDSVENDSSSGKVKSHFIDVSLGCSTATQDDNIELRAIELKVFGYAGDVWTHNDFDAAFP